MNIEIKETKEIHKDEIIELYKANKWSSAEKPDLLYKALTKFAGKLKNI